MPLCAPADGGHQAMQGQHMAWQWGCHSLLLGRALSCPLTAYASRPHVPAGYVSSKQSNNAPILALGGLTLAAMVGTLALVS